MIYKTMSFSFLKILRTQGHTNSGSSYDEKKGRVISDQRDWQTANYSPSSKMRSLLLRTIALAKAIIWRCPMERLFPPLAISLSRVRRASSSSLWREKSPDARKASFNVASSFCANGSKFRRRVPANGGQSVSQTTFQRFC
jgi:hypothetical protein